MRDFFAVIEHDTAEAIKNANALWLAKKREHSRHKHADQ